jgi:ankyrin repeat protein
MIKVFTFLFLSLSSLQNGLTALHKAAKRGHAMVVKQLVASKRFDVNMQDRYGWTPLHWSAWSGQVSAIQALLSSNKCNVNAADRVRKRNNNYIYTSLKKIMAIYNCKVK